jgi:hypothetical protein
MIPADFSAFKNFNIAKHSYWEKTAEEINTFLTTGSFPEVAKNNTQQAASTVAQVANNYNAQPAPATPAYTAPAPTTPVYTAPAAPVTHAQPATPVYTAPAAPQYTAPVQPAAPAAPATGTPARNFTGFSF